MTEYPFCTCEEPMPDKAEEICLLCLKPFEQNPPTLGVSVSDGVKAEDKVGNS